MYQTVNVIFSFNYSYYFAKTVVLILIILNFATCHKNERTKSNRWCKQQGNSIAYLWTHSISMGADNFILPIPVFSLKYAPTVSLTVFTHQCKQKEWEATKHSMNKRTKLNLNFFRFQMHFFESCGQKLNLFLISPILTPPPTPTRHELPCL